MTANDPIKLVLVDDHKLMRETWKMLLESDSRIKVIAECASGAEAIACAKNLKPDVMMMDINMSPINGFEATREIVKDNPDIKIIGVSINNQLSYVRTIMQLGAKGYVTKNSTREEMLEAITTVQEGKTFICKEIQ